VPLVVSGHDYAVQIEGARHLRLQDLVIRGAERSAVLIAEDAEDTEQDAEDIELDGVTLYGTGAALRVGRTRGLRLVNCALRGHAAPWHSRAHHKYRALAGYLVYAAGRDFEFAHCEFTDHHDCIQLYFVDGVRFHHNRVDNFNDDGIEVGPKKERGRTLVYQNVISRCLNPFTLHGKPGEKPAPVASEPGSGVYIYRNVVDLRRGTYKVPPTAPDPTGAFLNHRTEMAAHDHGGPTWPVYHVYHNTFLMAGPAWRNYYAFGWSSHLRGTTRRVFNNVFVLVEGVPGLSFAGVTADDDLQADGNLHWSIQDGPKLTGDLFEKFRRSALFTASKKRYPPGWGAGDLLADPRFVALDGGGRGPFDLRLQKGSPAIDAGVELPGDWPDPVRTQDQRKPDVGAFPFGVGPLKIGPALPE
jgi:hypothetical protein